MLEYLYLIYLKILRKCKTKIINLNLLIIYLKEPDEKLFLSNF